MHVTTPQFIDKTFSVPAQALEMGNAKPLIKFLITLTQEYPVVLNNNDGITSKIFSLVENAYEKDLIKKDLVRRVYTLFAKRNRVVQFYEPNGSANNSDVKVNRFLWNLYFDKIDLSRASSLTIKALYRFCKTGQMGITKKTIIELYHLLKNTEHEELFFKNVGTFIESSEVSDAETLEILFEEEGSSNRASPLRKKYLHHLKFIKNTNEMDMWAGFLPYFMQENALSRLLIKEVRTLRLDKEKESALALSLIDPKLLQNIKNLVIDFSSWERKLKKFLKIMPEIEILAIDGKWNITLNQWEFILRETNVEQIVLFMYDKGSHYIRNDNDTSRKLYCPEAETQFRWRSGRCNLSEIRKTLKITKKTNGG